jgi:hypothetical protein
MAANAITPEKVWARYDAVVHLVTAADGADKYYKQGHVTDDNGNAVFREESAETARALDNKIRAAWNGHPNVGLIGNLDDGFDGKMARATALVKTTVGV